VPEFRIADLVDVAIVAGLVWAALSFVRRSRARIALAGVAIAGALFLLARQLELQMTVWLLQGFFAVLVLVLVVVFQEDLRRLFEQIAVWSLRRKGDGASPDVVDALVGAVRRLVADRSGALLVLPGREPIDRHVAGGIPLGGQLSEPLLLSLFDRHSPGHDGAVLLEGGRVSRFAVHLPLSTDSSQIGVGGTRHAAALGLAERSDALVIVVSEERGVVSVARDGRLVRLPGPEALVGELRRFLAERGPAPRGPANRMRSVLLRWPEALLALGASAGLWLLLVPGSTVSEFERSVPVVVENLPAGYDLVSVDPPSLQVVFRGPRRSVFLGGAQGRSEAHVDALLAQLGRRTFDVGPEQIRHPEFWEPVHIEPPRVKLSIVPRSGAPDKPTAAN